ncbi:diguanylate cyclase (GGDEF)-like protein [Roseibium hamelinense]|uniref:diguanylate cyclase n=1 Tax=Roseibium hamelinense TaxID=150831 RepID=A0A562TA17_9HYPH|nr:diguanylate cyclase [Roseibium hamelinense]MTI43526.1 diguanylate cyclase [Roseibium hamelinense]TWI89680.1 diguanylate cyclase (GGDEF)-like protein [Roseibium hamelinense]
MHSILLVEDAAFFEKAALRKLADVGDYDVTVARTYRQAKELLESGDILPSLALVDLTLPDAPDGEIVDLTGLFAIPTVVFTSRYEPAMRNEMRQKGIIDYVIKDSPSSLDYIGELVHQLWRNPEIGILVIDDSTIERTRLSDILDRHRYRVYEAESAADGLSLIERFKDIRLVLVDYFMPGEDGFSFLKAVRRRHSRDKLAVIGMSGYEDDENRIAFLKYGANDFVQKTCSPEELLLRVSQNLYVIDRFSDLNERALRDPLTGLYNRRFLFSEGLRSMRQQIADGDAFWITLIDLDNFKAINDTHGHLAGDRALKTVADEISKVTGPGEYAVRLGGDEFCMTLAAQTEAQVMARAQSFLIGLARQGLLVDDTKIHFTVSMGAAPLVNADLESALKIADTRLYKAKSEGRNRMVAG